MAVTSKEVALQAGVSLMTVSRVFNPRPGLPIADSTRERVYAAARELGYQPNRVARALATGRTNVITLYIPELSAYYTEVVRCVHALLQADRYETIMLIAAFLPEQPEKTLLEIPPFPTDGVLTVDLFGSLPTELLRRSNGPDPTPLVTIGSPPRVDMDSVGTDFAVGVTRAMEHLQAAGARRIGFVTWDFVNHSGDPRRDAYDAFMRRAGLETACYPVSWPARLTAWRELPALLAAQPLPDALLCFNDELAIGTQAVLRERGVRVPEDILLCGCDGIPDTELLFTPLTTIRLPIEEMCTRAWTLLRERMANPDLPPRCELVNPHLIVRRSTART